MKRKGERRSEQRKGKKRRGGLRRREKRGGEKRTAKVRIGKQRKRAGRGGEDGRKISGGLEHDWFFTYGGQVAWIQRRETPI